MKIALIYPYIIPKADALRPAFERFIDTYLKFPAGIDHTLIMAPCNGEEIPDQDFRTMIDLANARIGPYYFGEGRDIGCHQYIANWLPPRYDFVVFCSSQVYFHREGWLSRMAQEREVKGPGLFGGMASNEQGRPHIRTCFYGTDPALMRSYPEVVNSRVKALQFESQPNYFLGTLLPRGMTGYLVTFDGAYGPESFRAPANIFRRGNQSNCLVWDHHTDLYFQADDTQKRITERLADGHPNPYG